MEGYIYSPEAGNPPGSPHCQRGHRRRGVSGRLRQVRGKFAASAWDRPPCAAMCDLMAGLYRLGPPWALN